MTLVVTAFGEAEFVEAIANEFVSSGYMVANRPLFIQVFYLVGYLDHLGAKTIVVEDEYVDRDYLADYSTYYATCFDQFGTRCRRLHFFTNSFTDEEFRSLLQRAQSEGDDELRKAYLGFVVARPLPEAVIGRTVLRTYETQPQRAYATRPYSVNLFGLQLSLDSLAYQEQDTVVAACATVALWTAFHKTAHQFELPVPRPAEITAAANSVQGGGRAMPSRGLRTEQIFAAIRRAGLEPVAESVNKQTILMSLLYGYLEFGLPVVLLGHVAEADYGGHAITISGYSTSPNLAPTREARLANIASVGEYIDKLYVHDDNIGPFARSLPVAVPTSWHKHATALGVTTPAFALQAQDHMGTAQSTFVPSMAVVPVYGKVRITYSEAHSWIAKLQNLIGFVGVATADLTWSIALTTTQRYKTLLREVFATNPKTKELLFEQQPRFLWRGVAKLPGDKLVLECLIDATGVSRSCPVIDVLWHDAAVQSQFQSNIKAISKGAIANAFTPRFADVMYG